MRTVYWSNWGITFYQGNNQSDLTKVKELQYAIGPQGPVDGTIGSPTRKRYEKICAEWVEKGILP